MSDDESPLKPPISPQPITTTVEGIAIETGYIPASVSSPQATIEREDRRVFGRTVPADLEALRAACQRPPDIEPLRLYYDGEDLSTAPNWRGTRVEIIAFPLATHGQAGNETIRFPTGHPWVYWEFPNIDGPCIVARWCHRHPGQPRVLEVGWGGGRSADAQIRQAFFPGQIRRSVHFLGAGAPRDASRLMALWTATSEAALRPRTRTAQEYIHHRGRVLAMYCRERGITDPMALSRPDVAEALGYADDHSLRNALHQKNVKTSDIKAEAYRLLRDEVA